ncbi:MFS transporter [Glutamicibacter sp. JL.03c]|uniref:MFS transporter n=1 Tax=Glutamicibacter sp. JL.03c TaxID=2984842 RepID=UPI0021F7FE34|nr:MFS transporter [Glutamicibacter sp. JL.03c]UYQ77756.1 MFS transporter [Glutamicibacter sp. JL.03c]
MTSIQTLGSHQRDRLQKRTLSVLVIMQIVGTVGVGVAPSIGILLAGEITQNEAWAGLARTASTLGAALMGVPLGALAARRGRRFALSSGWWVAAAGSALLVLAAQRGLVLPLFIGLFLMGAGLAVSLQARFAATDLAEPRRHGRSLALIVWVGTIGSVLGPNLAVPGRLITAATGLSLYASAFLIAAVCMAVAGLVSFALLRPDPLLESQRDADAPAAGHCQPGAFAMLTAELRVNAAARYAVFAVVSAQIVMVAIMTMTPVHLTHHGSSIEIVGMTISLHILGMYAFAPVVGQLTDRLGHRASILIGLLIFLVSLLLGAARPDDTGGIIASLILLGLGWSFVNVAGSALFSSVVSSEARAASQGGVDALSNLCGAIAAFAAGPLLAATSFPFLSILAIFALVPLAVLVVARALHQGAQP